MATFLAAVLLVPAGSAEAVSPKPGEGVEKTLVRLFRNDHSVYSVPTGVIALGDSYSSGLGAGDYDDDCDRTSRAWAMSIFADTVPPANRAVLACSGADIDDVYRQLDQLVDLGGGNGRLITLTVGGNDIGFANELSRCFIPLVGCADRESVLMDRIDALVDPLTELYRDVQALAPTDMLIVGGYPLLVPDPDVRSQCRALTPLLSTAERQMIRRLGLALNDAIGEAASAAGVRSAGSHLVSVFDGHEACDNAPDDWIYGLRLSRGAEQAADDDPEVRWDLFVSFVRESFHPTLAGQGGYAEAFTRAWGEPSSP
ncbi:SGNH/GDSL hydrolase family protein [Phytoactinopolyspora limicola]|uniref:SGNH/GDSL hydrolase family protein n=1 Tax=Phytoactinopolyspora limicola TaxID=2715536 RepID=UPI00140E644D|nr:SGNH/GDSL hydrolase family protein [Phytoactinopolyspora limicola]